MRCAICGEETPSGMASCMRCGSQPTVKPDSARLGNFAETLAPRAGIAKPMTAETERRTVGTRFQVVEVLGRGGMGIVYRAKDMELGGEEVAVKVLQSSFTQDPHELDRLKREIITARRVSHPNVLRVYEFGVSGAEAFLSMEVLVGGTLADRMTAGALPIDEALRISTGIAHGLASAHAQGIVHRDLKPANVMFDGTGNPKLVDFGLARLHNTAMTVGFSGTPQYMSPEMADGDEITARSDVYSLGVLLFHLFTGRLPFQADTMLRLAMLHAKQAPPAPRSIRAEIPAPVEAVILKALSKRKEDRFSDASEIAAALDAITEGRDAGVVVPAKHGRAPAIALGVTTLSFLAGASALWIQHYRAGVLPTPTPVAVIVPYVPPPAPTVLAVKSVSVPADISCRPWCEIWIDGQKLGRIEGLALGKTLPSGKHEFRFVNEGEANPQIVRSFDVPPGAPLRLIVNFPRNEVTLESVKKGG